MIQLARTIAVDFDGVLHPYTDGWQGSVPVDEPPTPGADHFLANLVANGFEAVVFSTRADHPEGLTGILDWLDKYALSQYVEDVTHTKPPAIAYVDDRAVAFTGSWPEVYQGINRLVDSRAHGAGNQPLVLEANAIPEPTKQPASLGALAPICVLCLVEPHTTVEEALTALTICRGYAVCLPHLPIVASGADWAVIHNAMLRRLPREEHPDSTAGAAW